MLGRSNIDLQTGTVDGGTIPDGMIVSTSGDAYWEDPQNPGPPGPYVFEFEYGTIEPDPTYREQRLQAYIDELSPEQTFRTSMGDAIDAIIKHIYGDSTDLDAIAAKIADIKQRYPKPTVK
jgi:hypothetical protein